MGRSGDVLLASRNVMSYIVAILLSLIATFGTAGYFYYQQAEAQIAQLTLENSVYEAATEAQKETIENLQTAMTLQGEELNSLTEKNGEIQQEMNRYLSIFKRHNLSKLADAKPGLIEKRVNDGTQKVFDSIRDDTATK